MLPLSSAPMPFGDVFPEPSRLLSGFHFLRGWVGAQGTTYCQEVRVAAVRLVFEPVGDAQAVGKEQEKCKTRVA